MSRARRVLTEAGEICVVALTLFGVGAAIILLGVVADDYRAQSAEAHIVRAVSVP